MRWLKGINAIDGNELIVEIIFPKQRVIIHTFLLGSQSSGYLSSTNTHSLVKTGKNDENCLARKLSTLSFQITGTYLTPECGFTLIV